MGLGQRLGSWPRLWAGRLGGAGAGPQREGGDWGWGGGWEGTAGCGAEVGAGVEAGAGAEAGAAARK